MTDFYSVTKWATADRPLIALEEMPRLLAEWGIECNGRRFFVPAGTQTDGASIPRFLWRVCGHPLEVPRAYAALAHDWLYGGGIADVTRAEADEIYYRLLRHFGISGAKARIEWAALRLCGGSHWHD